MKPTLSTGQVWEWAASAEKGDSFAFRLSPSLHLWAKSMDEGIITDDEYFVYLVNLVIIITGLNNPDAVWGVRSDLAWPFNKIYYSYGYGYHLFVEMPTGGGRNCLLKFLKQIGTESLEHHRANLKGNIYLYMSSNTYMLDLNQK